MTHFISTPAALSICARCDMPTLTALDEGIPARVDLLPLPDLAAEVAAIAHGHWTYARLPGGGLAYRDEHRLAEPTPPGRIHAKHVCTPRRTAR